jgi:methylated-DNA-[protein]-cysteine S-methyltransferase
MSGTGNHIQSAVIDSPIGKLGLHARGDLLVKIEFLPEHAAIVEPEDSFLKSIAGLLTDYFHNSSKALDVPVAMQGTDFQKRVWHELQNIPAGHVLSYGQLAERVASSPRAVGNACRENPIPVVVPCHRVVAADHMGGFSGQRSGPMVDKKQWLLTHEGIHFE